MNCPNCGAQLPDSAKFCSKCGVPLHAAAAPPAEGAAFGRPGAQDRTHGAPGAGLPASDVPRSAAPPRRMQFDPSTGLPFDAGAPAAAAPGAQTASGPAAGTGSQAAPASAAPAGQEWAWPVQDRRTPLTQAGLDPRTGRPVAAQSAPGAPAPGGAEPGPASSGAQNAPAYPGSAYSAAQSSPAYPGSAYPGAQSAPQYDPRTRKPILTPDQAYVVPRPAPAEQSAAAVSGAGQPAQVRSARLSGGRKAAAAVHCVLLALVLFAAALLGAAKLSFSREQVEDLAASAELGSLRMTGAGGREVSFARWVEEQCRIDFEAEYGISEQELAAVLDDPAVRSFAGGVLGRYAAWLVQGEALAPLTRAELVEFFRKNDARILELTGYSFLAYEYETCPDRTGELLDVYSLDGIFLSLGFSREETDKMAVSAEALERVGFPWKTVQTLLAGWVFPALCLGAVLLIALLFLILRGEARSALGHVGAGLLAAGALTLASGGCGKLGLFGAPAGLLCGGLFTWLLIFGGLLAVFGLALILLSRAIRA